MAELVTFLLPLRGQPGNHREGQTGRRSENPSKAGRSHPALIPLTCISHSTSATCGPRRQDGGPEPLPLVTSLTRRSSTRRARISMGQLGVPTLFRPPQNALISDDVTADPENAYESGTPAGY